MFKKVFVLTSILLSLNAVARVAPFNGMVAAGSDYCAEEKLHIREFNSGEAFYLWTTGSKKIA